MSNFDNAFWIVLENIDAFLESLSHEELIRLYDSVLTEFETRTAKNEADSNYPTED